VTLHADALATLRSWPAPDPVREDVRVRMVEHLEQHPDGVLRACFPDHLTAGTLVLAADGSSVLLNLHRKARRWLAFGGHCEDDDATLAGAALREATEESDLPDLALHPVPVDVDAHVVGFCDPRGPVTHLDVRYAALAAPDARHAASEESLDVRWWPLDALPEGLGDEMHRLIGAARAALLEPEPGATGQSTGSPSSTSSSPGGGSRWAAAE
jgi:8-oxo-dGTP pyrophosphatase MutT (NUDIX family)